LRGEGKAVLRRGERERKIVKRGGQWTVSVDEVENARE
jgi:hypothetical protein